MDIALINSKRQRIISNNEVREMMSDNLDSYIELVANSYVSAFQEMKKSGKKWSRKRLRLRYLQILEERKRLTLRSGIKVRR